MKKDWLITGGLGFLGTSLIQHLRKLYPEINIRVLDNLSVGKKENLAGISEFKEVPHAEINNSPEGTELVVGDIVDAETCFNASKGVNTVIHLAANTGVDSSVKHPGADMRSNVIGTFNMLEAAKLNSIDKFIFASSGAPLGEVDPPIHEEKAPKPVSPYGASKLAGEAYCSAYFRTFGTKTVSLRFSNVYGPGSKHKNSVVASFIKNALDDKPLEIYGDGNQTRDFLYIEDLLQAVILSSEKNIGGEVFQIASHRETTVNEIAEMLNAIITQKTGKTIKFVYAKERVGDVRRNFSDISKARNILEWVPKWNVKDGLSATVEWFL